MSDTGIFLSLGLLSLLKAICHKTVNQEEHISRKITIFDATLCDGEQSPGASMNTEEKLFIARQLVRMNVALSRRAFPSRVLVTFAPYRRLARLRATDARYAA